ncbi:hypothetical protein GCM10022221_26260 [Actinocorallia aurea]
MVIIDGALAPLSIWLRKGWLTPERRVGSRMDSPASSRSRRTAAPIRALSTASGLGSAVHLTFTQDD